MEFQSRKLRGRSDIDGIYGLGDEYRGQHKKQSFRKWLLDNPTVMAIDTSRDCYKALHGFRR